MGFQVARCGWERSGGGGYSQTGRQGGAVVAGKAKRGDKVVR
nr:hypothetical protein [Hydrogenophilus thermoluteolus]